MMTDYIERKALREILDGWRDAHADVDDVHGCGLLEDVICEVDAQPAADVAEVVHGQWGDNGIPGSMLSGCSVCGFSCGANSFFYCPNCGAKMDGGERK
mgnify:CR=1 FL=1